LIGNFRHVTPLDSFVAGRHSGRLEHVNCRACE
jgi:hypothetical protein